MKILVTDGNYNQTLCIVRALGKKGMDVAVLANKPRSLAGLSKYCKKEFSSPRPTDESNFIKFLCSIAHNFDLLIPVGSNSVRVVSKYRAELDKLIRIELASPESVFTALNKRITYEIAKKVGVPVPWTVYPAEIEEIETIKSKLPYPVVIKALEDTGTHIVEYINTEAELSKKYAQLCALYNFKPPSLPMIQERIQGDGYGFFALYQKGELKRLFMHHRIREYPVTGGASSCAESIWDSKLKEYGKRILDELAWHGVCMVEFKGVGGKVGKGLSLATDYKLMEVNPKFWGSLDLAIEAGVDFPYLLCEMAAKDKLPLYYRENYKVGLKFHWPFSDDLLHIIKKPTSFPKFIVDCLTAKSNIWRSDLLPNLAELKETIKRIIH